MSRGRLIFPFIVELAQLDTVAMTRDPDGPGPETSGYDIDFREPIIIKANVDDVKGEALREETCIRLRCQIEDSVFEAVRQVLGGTSPNSKMTLVFHFKELEEKNLIDENGRAMIRLHDRLRAIYDCTGKLIETIPDPPGLFINDVTPAGFGIGRQRNLLIVGLQERELGTQSAAR